MRDLETRRAMAGSVLLTAILLGAGADWRPSLGSSQALRGEDIGVFWADKAGLGAAYDAVVAGDSRVYRGLVPEVLEAELGGRVANFGFSGTGFEARYLERLSALLRGDGRRILVLSITPSSLTARAAQENGFLDSTNHQAATATALRRLAGPLLRRFEPYSYAEILDVVGWRRLPFVYREDYRSSGWVASDQEPRDDTRACPSYREFFQGNRVDARQWTVLVEHTERWRGSGIRVFAMRMPISAALRRVEDSESGMDWAAFVTDFEAAGGTWLGDFSGDPRFRTYDGSHLPAQEARDFSGVTAARLRERLFPERPSGSEPPAP